MKDTEFEKRNKHKISQMYKDKNLVELTNEWFKQSYQYEYSYHFRWLGRPVIQYPQDIIALQEIIWQTNPELIIETGIARGGSIIFLASMLELIGNGMVIGIDVDLRKDNEKEIKKHPLYQRVKILNGSSTEKKITNKVYSLAKNKSVMVILDSNHTKSHVLNELEIYSPLVKKGNYLVVFDTIIENLPEKFFINRKWGKKNNPKSAIEIFLNKNNRFKMDKSIEKKLLITAAPSGYLKCVRD